ncbi:MAG: glycerol kinase GlpK [Sphaerochaetaceae bacterium]|nr:glycerol kinase GlpK [Sphaerochaetaceae bacterium]
MARYIGAIDQGTTSTRFILFDENGMIVQSHQLEHKQYFPNPGWVEHDPEEIWNNTVSTMKETLLKSGIDAGEVAAIGITNQRETIIPFNPKTGEVYHRAIVWQDLRGSQIIDNLKEKVDEEWLRAKTGLLFSPYFSGSKIKWLLDNVDGLKEKAESGDCIFGTIDCYLTYKLTGQVVTDVTNASRYMLMNISSLSWDEELCDMLSIPSRALPKIVPSIGEVYGECTLFGASIPVCGILGDQQAALFGQACFDSGEAKCTYGTGCFLLENTGEKLCLSKYGLISTVAYQIKGEKPVYALEGSIAVAGSLVQWVRDNLKMVKNAKELDELALEVSDCGGVYIVPAFAGLFAPYWRSDARGVIAGLTGYADRRHICRAVLEATAFQVYDIFEAMAKDSGIALSSFKVDGGLTNSAPLMAFQADLLGIPVIRPKVIETTALGAAYAAGLSIGIWQNRKNLSRYWKEQLRWTPDMEEGVRSEKIALWSKAVSRTLNWEKEKD